MSKLGKLVGMAASGAVGIASGAIYGFVKQEKRIDLVEEQMKKSSQCRCIRISTFFRCRLRAVRLLV